MARPRTDPRSAGDRRPTRRRRADGRRALIRLVAVGRPRGPLADAARDYEARLAKVLRFEAVDVRDGRPFEHHLTGFHVVCLDRSGIALTSADLAAFVREREELSPQRTAFVIGGADGLPASVLAAAQTRLSLGPATLPHQLARVVLVEQLYRATTILRGEPYHR